MWENRIFQRETSAHCLSTECMMPSVVLHWQNTTQQVKETGRKTSYHPAHTWCALVCYENPRSFCFFKTVIFKTLQYSMFQSFMFSYMFPCSTTLYQGVGITLNIVVLLVLYSKSLCTCPIHMQPENSCPVSWTSHLYCVCTVLFIYCTG